MHYTPGLSKLINVNLKYATKIYGVNVEIYAAVNDNDSGLQSYGDVKYSDEPIYTGKLLIPEYLYRESQNPYGFSDFTDTTFTAYTREKLPRLSKVIITEIKDLVSFIISDAKDSRDSSLATLFYTYTLIPSSQIIKRANSSVDNMLDLNEALEEDELLDKEFNNFLQSNNEQSNTPVSEKIIYDKL